MSLETHYYGRVLFLRIVTGPVWGGNVGTIVEDEKGNVERLAVNFVSWSTPCEHYLRKGSVLAIKEPLYEFSPDGRQTLRINHLSDMIFLTDTDERVPAKFRPSREKLTRTPLDWKEAGNAAIARKNYLEALAW